MLQYKKARNGAKIHGAPAGAGEGGCGGDVVAQPCLRVGQQPHLLCRLCSTPLYVHKSSGRAGVTVPRSRVARDMTAFEFNIIARRFLTLALTSTGFECAPAESATR